MSWIDDLKATCVECGTRCLICPFKKLLREAKQLLKWLGSFIWAPKCILCPFVKLAKFLWRQITKLFWRYRWIAYTILAVFALAAINLIAVHICIVLDVSLCKAIKWLPDLILKIVGTNSEKLIKDGDYKTVISDMIALCAFIFAVLPIIQAVIYKLRLKKELKDKYGFDFKAVKKQGGDDIDLMLERYKGADTITIFGGGFDWIGDRPEVEEKFLEYAREGKLTLISFRLEKDVEKIFTDKDKDALFNDLKHHLKSAKFRFNSKLDEVKCSVIRAFGQDKFLFRQSSNSHRFNAGFLGSSEYSRELLQIIYRFSSNKQWGDECTDVPDTLWEDRPVEPSQENGE